MIEMLIPWALCLIVLLVSVYTREQDRKEREQLVNRIMAKDYGEYTHGMRPPPKPGQNFLENAIRKAYAKGKAGGDDDDE